MNDEIWILRNYLTTMCPVYTITQQRLNVWTLLPFLQTSDGRCQCTIGYQPTNHGDMCVHKLYDVCRDGQTRTQYGDCLDRHQWSFHCRLQVSHIQKYALVEESRTKAIVTNRHLTRNSPRLNDASSSLSLVCKTGPSVLSCRSLLFFSCSFLVFGIFLMHSTLVNCC